ncbi:hypothetical protein, partial [Nocardia terpenica]|uniref:hypothetical protein n=1 Tax=Nocardia terpenica TaxID=455432 RepID=UPI001E323087
MALVGCAVIPVIAERARGEFEFLQVPAVLALWGERWEGAVQGSGLTFGDGDVVGGKAWGLGLLRGAGFRVPEWVVVEGRVFGGLGGGLVSEVEGFVGEVELGAALRR